MGPRLVVSEFPNDNPELHDGLVWACPTPCAPALPTLRLRQAAAVRVLGPGWERPEPVVAPSVSEAPPVIAEAPPVVTEAQPVIAEAQPVIAEAQPVVTEAQPVVTEAQPVIAEAQPVVAEAQPVIAEAQPVIAEAQPVIAEAPSVVRAVEPLVEEVEPVSEQAEAVSEPAPPSGFAAFVAALRGILLERGATRAAANVGALVGLARLGPDAFDADTKKTLVSRGMLDAKSGRPTPEFSVITSAWRDVLDDNGADLAACGSATLDVFGGELLATLLGSPRSADELRRALRQRGVAAFGMLVAA